MSGIGANNGFNEYNKNTDKVKVEKILEKATSDGIVTPKEKAEIFNAGFNVKDRQTFQELKQGINTDFEDIARVFEEGFETGQKSDEIGSAAEAYAKDLGKTLVKDISTLNPLRVVSDAASRVYELGSEILKDLSLPDDKESEILSKSKNNIEKAKLQKEAVTEQNIFRQAAGVMAEAYEKTSDMFRDLSAPDDKEKEALQKASAAAKAGAAASIGSIVGAAVGAAQKAYEIKEADLETCVDDALKDMGIKNNGTKGFINLDEKQLEAMTGRKWDAIDVSQSEDLKSLTKGHGSKALVTDGAHAYVFKGLDSNGNLKVYDATAGTNKTISRDNKAVTLYVQGKGDADLTGKAEGDKNVFLFNSVNSLKDINSVDKGKDGKPNESWEIRKIFIMMGDPSEAKSVARLGKAVKAGDEAEVNKILKEKGINIDKREVKAMIASLNAPTKGEFPSAMDKFLWLNKKATSDSPLTINQTNYMKAVQYSNVDLNNFFSSAITPEEKGKSVSNVIEEVIKGKSGC